MPALAQVELEQNTSKRVQPPTVKFREEWNLGVCDEEDMKWALCVEEMEIGQGERRSRRGNNAHHWRLSMATCNRI